jgi:hypothetical protein
MITASRHGKTIDLTPLLWDAAQVLARGEGWRPAGAIDMHDRQRHALYEPGRLVDSRDARAFADALTRVINGEHGGSGEIDLGALAAVANFVRGRGDRACNRRRRRNSRRSVTRCLLMAGLWPGLLSLESGAACFVIGIVAVAFGARLLGQRRPVDTLAFAGEKPMRRSAGRFLRWRSCAHEWTTGNEIDPAGEPVCGRCGAAKRASHVIR